MCADGSGLDVARYPVSLCAIVCRSPTLGMLNALGLSCRCWYNVTTDIDLTTHEWLLKNLLVLGGDGLILQPATTPRAMTQG